MRNIIIILATLLVVVVCAFLPELLMNNSAHPELSGDYQMVAVTSESSSDYAWRMERIAEHYFGEGEHLLSTYISEISPSEEGSEAHTQFLGELDKLVEIGAVPSQVRQMLEGDLSYRIRYYYLFDSEAVSGFRIAEFVAAATNWRVTMCLDVESGKLVKVEYGGSKLIPGGLMSPHSSWYDVLRGFSQYLGMNTTPATPPEVDRTLQPNRRYYDSITADQWTANLTGQAPSWLQLRVLRESYLVRITVYDGGTGYLK